MGLGDFQKFSGWAGMKAVQIANRTMAFSHQVIIKQPPVFAKSLDTFHGNSYNCCSMNILITGGAGFIGSHLALALKKERHNVRVIDNFDPFYNPAIKRKNARLLSAAGIPIHELDLSLDPLEPVMEKMEIVIHAAAQPGISADIPYSSYIKNNFQSTANLVGLLEGTPASLIYVSTSSVYGINASGNEKTPPAPVSPYGVTKLAAEEAVLSAVRRGTLKACIVRCFSVFGERERPDKVIPRLFAALKHDTPFSLYDGSLAHERSYTYVGDIVNGTMLAMNNLPKKNGEIFNVGTNKSNMTAEVLELAQKISGKKLRINHLPARSGDQLVTRADIGKAQAVLGYQPQTSLSEGMEKTWAWASKEL